VVTDVQFRRVEKRIKLDGKGMKYFIDNVILPTLGNMREKYRGFLETLEESNEECFQQMAKKLGKYVCTNKIRVNCDICYNFGCNTFTPQIKEIPEGTFAMYTSTQGDISLYTSVH